MNHLENVIQSLYVSMGLRVPACVSLVVKSDLKPKPNHIIRQTFVAASNHWTLEIQDLV